MGNYVEAENTFGRVLKIWKQAGNLFAQAGLLNNMGSLFHQEGEYEKAAYSYQDGLLCARRSQHTRMETLISIGLGDLYTELQDVEIADQNYAYAERMLTERNDLFLLFSLPKMERRKKQHYVAIRMAVPIPFGKYLQPAWDEVYDWLESKNIKPSGPAIIRYLTTDMSKELDIDVAFTVDKAVKGDKRIIAGVLPAGRYATLLYTGLYKGKGIFKATVALLEWAKENKIKWDTSKKKGVEWWNGRAEFYFSNPAVEKNPKQFRPELVSKVKEKK